ncbi:hypothetical protein FIU87_07620 [Bacillus sp. THAF10]|nr:hypothetical protein FIU87_07620 [Bacillus sp. THAF10]
MMGRVNKLIFYTHIVEKLQIINNNEKNQILKNESKKD